MYLSGIKDIIEDSAGHGESNTMYGKRAVCGSLERDVGYGYKFSWMYNYFHLFHYKEVNIPSFPTSTLPKIGISAQCFHIIASVLIKVYQNT